MRLIIITLLTLCLTVNLTASVDPYDVVIMSDPTTQTAVLRTTLTVERDTRIRFTDGQGNELFAAEVPAGEFVSKRFSVSALIDGHYQFVLQDERGRTTLPFKLANGLVAYSPANATLLRYPDVELRANNLLVVRYPATEGPEVAVELAHYSGASVFKDKVASATATRKAYRLDQLAAGSYVLTVNMPSAEKYSTAITLR